LETIRSDQPPKISNRSTWGAAAALLREIAEELDIPAHKYREAVEHYTAIAEWLENGNYPGTRGKPQLYVQGSFRLSGARSAGSETCDAKVIKPMRACHLSITRFSLSGRREFRAAFDLRKEEHAEASQAGFSTAGHGLPGHLFRNQKGCE
jgi:hypothetical protein